MNLENNYIIDVTTKMSLSLYSELSKLAKKTNPDFSVSELLLELALEHLEKDNDK